jgi:hypothetical protein
MGRTTFEPALTNDRWPWPNSDPARLLEKLRAANQGGAVHLVGGPRTIETFRALDARLTFMRERALQVAR